MSKRLFLTFVILVLPVMPAISFAGRSLYLFDLLPLTIFLFCFFLGRSVLKRSDYFFIISVILLALIVVFFQAVLWGQVHSYSILRFSYVAMLVPFLKAVMPISEFEKYSSRLLVIVAILGIFQFFDGYVLGNYFGVNRFVSTLYPYSGELSESSLLKTDGYYLKSGSLFRATSIADGHPIILGDLLASLSVFLLFWRRYLSYAIVACAVFATFSRASWLMLFVGFLVYFIFEFRRLGVWFYFLLFLVCFVSLGLIFSIDSLYDAFYFRVMNTLYVFGFSDIPVGSSYDPRTEVVWPQFFEAMNSVGWVGYLVGYDVRLPADSGFFTILRESGIAGLLIFLSFSIYAMISSGFDKKVVTLLFVVFVGMVFHPIHQGYKTVYLISVFLAFYMVPLKQQPVYR